ncbi:MAG: hypothetical protein C4523_04755 [Myxococcales bacterium]|nr:MAG: hypothetical protein C4523_04755 [Myxococcales bacterium]
MENLVSETGRQSWITHYDEYFKPLKIKYLAHGIQLPPKYDRASHDFRTWEEFCVCYAFDVYRRGWEYLERVRLGGEKYLPHKLRDLGTDLPTVSWRDFNMRVDIFANWGEYISNLLSDPGSPAYRDPKLLAELIRRIRSATREHKLHLLKLDLTEGVSDHEYLKEIQQEYRAVVKDAKVPIIPSHQPLDRAQEINEVTSIAIDLAVGIPCLVLTLVRLLIKTLDSLDWVKRIETKVECIETATTQFKRHAVDRVYKGKYGYTGLFPE